MIAKRTLVRCNRGGLLCLGRGRPGAGASLIRTSPSVSSCRFRRAARPTSRRGSSASTCRARFGQQVVRREQTGANGNIGIETAAKSAPDGYTVLW